MTTSASRAALACALLATTCLAHPAIAQATYPAYDNSDENGVDLTHGDHLFSFVEGSIGSGDGELSLVRKGPGIWPNSGWDNIELQLSTQSGNLIARVRNGRRWDSFTNGVPAKANGTSLTPDGAGNYVFQAADGTRVTFMPKPSSAFQTGCNPASQTCTLIPSSITSPDGKTVSLSWDSWIICDPQVPDTCWIDAVRLAEVSNSFGYAIRFIYAADGEGGQSGPLNPWFHRTGATFHNNAVGSAAQASVSYAFPNGSTTDVTDTGGRVWRFTGMGTITGIRRPGASSDTTTINYSSGIVTSIVREGVSTGYSRSVSGNTATMVVTNALSQASTVVSDLNVGRPTAITDPLSRTTSFQYDGNGRLTRITQPEGNYVQYTLDGRGNVTQTQAVAKSGSGLATITTSATFAASCTGNPSCNQPLTTTDARSNVTNYEYDPTHGGLTKVTLPAPTVSAVWPETRYAYTLTNGEYRLTGISACQTGSAPTCVGTADEVKTTLAYDANGNVTSTSSGAGDGSLTATSAMTYDAIGNLLTVDGPLAGSADTGRYRYNAARDLVGTISPDPDGGGALKHRAVRNTYTNGLLTKTERGTVNSQSDGDWAAFAPLEAVETGYDANARPVTQALTAGGTTYALTQASYDALGRPECVAQRMNPAAFGALPGSACTLGTQGSFGPDRIGKTIYDAAGQVTQVKTAFGTADEANEMTATYRQNGQVETLTDGETNKTTYVYDGHDRLFQTQFPHPTKGSGVSNASDYEQLGYDAAGNVTSRRMRDGQVIGLAFDNLNQLTLKDLPNAVSWENDVAYTYDLLGRLKSATDSYSHALTFTYDALGRQLTETSSWTGAIASNYDTAGRRTRLTWRDGNYVDYDYNDVGEMTAIRENGTTSGIGVLATFAYDDLGRRSSLSRGNGTATSYVYDPASRLASLTQDLAGTAYDVTIGLASYNPAGQLLQRTGSNDAYAWTAHGSGTAADAVNGLSQIVTTGATSVSHDGRGNISAIGGGGYSYLADNRIRTAPGGVDLVYDPLDRLYIGAAATAFAYQDSRLAYEVDSTYGHMLRRYVHGPGVDEPLVWYEGGDLSDRRWLHADERGSIVAVTDSAGNAVAINRYDEYGAPQLPSGRFGYTGQAWLPEAGLYYYKARMYHPRLGRFMQADPIGYQAGMNLYAYVKGDPVNFVDPSGTCMAVGGSFYPISGAPLYPGPCRGHAYVPFGGGGRFQLDEPLRGSEGGGGGASASPYVTDIPEDQKPPCGPSPNLALTFDIGVFLGYGGGFSLGFHWDGTRGVVSSFASARAGTGLGLIGGLGLNISNGSLNRGRSSTSNRAIGFGPGGIGISWETGQRPSANVGGSLGPKVGIEVSKTENLTVSKDITEAGTLLCRP